MCRFSIARLSYFDGVMNSSPLFCSGLELGKLALSSGLLQLSWSKISELHGSIDPNQDSNLRFQIYQEAKCTVVAFVAPPICTRRYLLGEDGSVNSAFTLLDGSSGSDAFRFLFSEKISSFSVHRPADELFASVYDPLKSQLFCSEKPLIVTGSELGGSVASLFTLWLLNNIEQGRKRPLCITFGSTLIGDASLQKLLENSIWNSYFLHVASTQDLFPKLLIPSDYSPNLADDPQAVTFKPFGTFLVSCDSGCVCIEDPNAVLELLAGINGGLASDNRTNIYDEILHRLERPIYGKMLHCLERSLLLTRGDLPGKSVSDWLLAGMFLQPDHIGMGRSQDVQEARMIHDVIMKMEERAKRKLQFDPFKKLIEMKINMVHLEWYKKSCRSKGIGYYDHFKSHVSQGILSVENFKKTLTDYWKYMVENAEKKPQSERAAFRKRFLYAGNIYRKMIEPLDIAEHYCNNSSREYITACRSRHYVMLERWFNEVEMCEKVSAKRDLTDLLTLDSCFWARVEEAMKSIRLLEKSEIVDDEGESLTRKLEGFEEYVWEMIGKRMVSPEIFLEDSSFMRWWREYKKFKGDGYESSFIDFMNKGRYKYYGIMNQVEI